MKKVSKYIEVKELKDFPGYYVGSDGNIFSSRDSIGKGRGGGSFSYINKNKFKKLKPRKSSLYGYFAVSLSIDGKTYQRYIHRLICEAFHGPCPEGMECSHLNGDNIDNRPKNLKWETPKINTNRKKEHGTQIDQSGFNNNKSKFNSLKDLENIFSLRYEGKTYKEIAEKMGVHESTIGGIIKGKYYSNLTKNFRK